MKHPPGIQPLVPASSPNGPDDDSPWRNIRTSMMIIRYTQKLISVQNYLILPKKQHKISKKLHYRAKITEKASVLCLSQKKLRIFALLVNKIIINP